MRPVGVQLPQRFLLLRMTIPVIGVALYSRFSSRENDEFASKVLSAMRYMISKILYDSIASLKPPQTQDRQTRSN